MFQTLPNTKEIENDDNVDWKCADWTYLIYCGVYFEINKNLFSVYNPITSKHTEMTLAELNKLVKKYEMMKGYDADFNGLVEYWLDFNKWNKELKDNGLIQFTFSYKNK